MPEPEPILVAPPVALAPAVGNGHSKLGDSIRLLRLRHQWSQRQLAAKLFLPRTYCSKLERARTTPNLRTLQKIAAALEVSVPELLDDGERSRREAIEELAKDPFIAQLQPFTAQLTLSQMRSVLAMAQDMALPKRIA